MKVAVIGCGYWGPGLVRNFTSILRDGMCAAADPAPGRLEGIKAQYPHLVTTTEPHNLLDRPDIDAVVIATPIQTHYDLAKAAIERGKHVLIEKPMTHSVATSEHLIALRDKVGATLMVDHTFVYTGAVRKMREMVDKGQLGRLYYFDSVRVNLGLFQHDVNVLWDLASHDAAVMDYVLQEGPVAVSAHGAAHFTYDEKPMEDIAYITVRYEDNLIGHIHVNWLAPVKVRKMLLGGSKKMIIYDDAEPTEKIKVYDKGVDIIADDRPENIYCALVTYRMGDMYAPNLDATEALALVCQHFIDCCLDHARPITDGHAGLRVVSLLEAAQLSMERGGDSITLKAKSQIVGH